jgi:hypothetical protein
MSKISFAQLNKENQINRTTTPMMVSLTQFPDEETREMMMQRHTKFLSLPEKIKDKLASIGISQKIQAIGQKYGFELLRLANITRLIREYYFGEVHFEDFPAEIEKRLSVSLLTAQEITRYIKSEIIDWDPWAEYVSKLPKMSVREMFERKLKIAGTEITAGYVELRGSDELEDPTIKNWIQDYITHLGYGKHSQMDRTQYLFHSENGKNLSSQDREKLGIILKSFDENIPLPVDEENEEIVFEGLISEQKSPSSSPFKKGGEATGKQESFIKPYNPIQESPRQIPRPTIAPPAPTRTVPTLNFANPISLPPRPPAGEARQTSAPAPRPSFVPPSGDAVGKPEEFVHPNFATQPNRQLNPEIEKYFNTPETPEIPPIKIHSMTEHNEPKSDPRPIVQRPAPIQPEPLRPQHRIINPFSPRIAEPRLDGNVVDLSANNDQ